MRLMRPCPPAMDAPPTSPRMLTQQPMACGLPSVSACAGAWLHRAAHQAACHRRQPHQDAWPGRTVGAACARSLRHQDRPHRWVLPLPNRRKNAPLDVDAGNHLSTRFFSQRNEARNPAASLSMRCDERKQSESQVPLAGPVGYLYFELDLVRACGQRFG
eukprot:365767-Chlamydomonas_euryale.AAC.2